MPTQDVPLMLHVQAERHYGLDEIQDAIERTWTWNDLARALGASNVTLRVEALGDDSPDPLRRAADLINRAHALAEPALPSGEEISGEGGITEKHQTLGMMDYLSDTLHAEAERAAGGPPPDPGQSPLRFPPRKKTK